MRPGDCITTDRLIIRHWNKASDGEAFHRLNNDPQIMRYFPARQTRAQSDALLDLIEQQIKDDGYGWSAIVSRKTGLVVGFGGIAKVRADFPNGPSTEIGWRFLPDVWGNGYATEMANAVLTYGFEQLRLPEILSFAVVENKKSIAVMKRIGMQRFKEGDFDHPRVDAITHPRLLRHHCYRISRENWREQKTAG